MKPPNFNNILLDPDSHNQFNNFGSAAVIHRENGKFDFYAFLFPSSANRKENLIPILCEQLPRDYFLFAFFEVLILDGNSEHVAHA